METDFLWYGYQRKHKPNSGKNIKEKLSGKPASILNTMITLEEFEAYEA